MYGIALRNHVNALGSSGTMQRNESMVIRPAIQAGHTVNGMMVAMGEAVESTTTTILRGKRAHDQRLVSRWFRSIVLSTAPHLGEGHGRDIGKSGLAGLHLQQLVESPADPQGQITILLELPFIHRAHHHLDDLRLQGEGALGNSPALGGQT